MTKFDKILFSIAIFLTLSFYGFLNISFYAGIVSSYVSAGLRCIVLLISGYLFLKDFMRRDIRLDNPPFVCYFILILLTSCILAIDDWRSYQLTQNLVSGKMFAAYNCFIVGGSVFFTFFCGRRRLNFLINNPIVIYLPAFFAVLVTVVINADSIANRSMAGNEYDLNRALTKETAINIFVVGMYYILFVKNVAQRFLLGGAAMILTTANLLMNESKSILVTIAFVSVYYAALAIRTVKGFITVVLTGILLMVFIIPIVMTGKGFERLMDLLYFRLAYWSGSTEVSRIDLIMNSLDMFRNSTMILGTGNFMSGSHLIFTEILVSTGLVGIALFFAFFFPISMNAWRLARTAQQNNMPGIILLTGLALANLTQNLFHGYTYSLYGSYFIPILLSLYIFSRYNVRTLRL